MSIHRGPSPTGIVASRDAGSGNVSPTGIDITDILFRPSLTVTTNPNSSRKLIGVASLFQLVLASIPNSIGSPIVSFVFRSINDVLPASRLATAKDLSPTISNQQGPKPTDTVCIASSSSVEITETSLLE